MGVHGDEFLKMREMESYKFDYYEPIVAQNHYIINVEAESKEKAIEKAKK